VGGANTVFFTARGFNSLGQTLGANFGNSVVTTNDYYASTKRLRKTATFKTGSTNIQDLTYTYDKVSNVKTITDGVYSGSASATLTGIQYDDLHRLTGLTHPTQGTKSYAYSPIGNVTANGELGADTYGYGVRMPHAVKTVGGIRSYGYDANGNMISRYGQKLEYDPENRLARLTTLTMTNTFGYAGDDERLWKQGPGGLQVWIAGIYEEKQGKVLFYVIAGGQKVCTFDATGTNVFEYYHADHLHSTSILTDTNGLRVQHHEYSAFGRDRFTDSTTAFPLSHRFTGQVLDEDTGLYYYGARYYDPELARFIQPDTIIPDFGDPQGYNRYSYVLNNPFKYVDPDGHDPKQVVESVLNFVGGTVIGVVDVINPIPIQSRPTIEPSSTAEYYGRQFGAGIGASISAVETVAGGLLIGLGSGGEVVTLGAATPIAVPVAGVGVAVGGHGLVGLNNFINMKRGGPSAGGKSQSGENPKVQTQTTPGKTKTAAELRQENIAKGIPPNQLGPSGKPKVHIVEKATLKQRKDAARQAGSGNPVLHNKDKGQPPHMHPVDKQGKKLTGKDNVHFQKRGDKPNPE
jgi:RHS repeat-associated protein